MRLFASRKAPYDWRSGITWPIKVIIKNTVEDITFVEKDTHSSTNLSTPQYRWSISIETNPESFVKMIHSVRYRFDQSFNFYEKEIDKGQSPDGRFKLSGTGSGEFDMVLDIKLERVL